MGVVIRGVQHDSYFYSIFWSFSSVEITFLAPSCPQALSTGSNAGMATTVGQLIGNVSS